MTTIHGRSERGSGSVLMIGVLAVLVVLGAVAGLVTGYVLAYHRARSAADLAVLSGAVAYEQGRPACPDADRVARANGVRLEQCDQVGDLIEFVVTVRVAAEVTMRMPGLPGRVEAEAHAGPRDAGR